MDVYKSVVMDVEGMKQIIVRMKKRRNIVVCVCGCEWMGGCLGVRVCVCVGGWVGVSDEWVARWVY